MINSSSSQKKIACYKRLFSYKETSQKIDNKRILCQKEKKPHLMEYIGEVNELNILSYSNLNNLQEAKRNIQKNEVLEIKWIKHNNNVEMIKLVIKKSDFNNNEIRNLSIREW